MHSLTNNKSRSLYIVFTVFTVILMILFTVTLILNEHPSAINCALYITVEGNDFVTECGGAVIKDGTIITVAHPFRNINSHDDIKISAYDKYNGKTYALTLIKTDFEKDLALLSCDSALYPHIDISDYPNVYRTLFYPSKKEFRYINKCNVSGVVNMDGQNLIVINRSVENGFSGYPIIDNSNTLIGIICSTDYMNKKSYVICGSTINDFVSEAMSEFE